MGFIIHKYFLSKSLKAPPPSESKKKKSSTPRRYSQPAIGSRGVAQPSAIDFLSVPTTAYASSVANSIYTPSAARRRRNSMATMRRASIAEGTMEDSMNSFEGSSLSKKQNRRMSLQSDYSSHQDESAYNPSDDLQNSFSSYYQLEDTKEEAPYGEWEESKRRPQRRFSTSSVSSSNMMETNHTRESTAVPSSRLRQENKWLQLQLKQYQRLCSQLEAKLYGARDQLAYTNATWLDQLYDAQHKHQQEVFQTQRQAEQASNMILEEEMEELKATLMRVATEEAKLAEKKKEFNGNEENDVNKLHSELKEWKERHSQATANAKRIQDILEHEARDRNARLHESERQVAWLQEQLQVALPREDNYDDSSCPINPQLVTMLQNNELKLESRIQELLMENAHLQRGQSEVYELQTQVKELKSVLQESQEQLNLHQAWHSRQMEFWKEETIKWKEQVQQLQAKLDQKMKSREAIRAEYSTRIESLETETVRLKIQEENRQKEWTHRLNMKNRIIENLQSQIGEGTLPPTATAPVERSDVIGKLPTRTEANKLLDTTFATEDTVLDGTSSSLSSNIPETGCSTALLGPSYALTQEGQLELHQSHLREKNLLLQISRLEESEANAQRQVQRAHDQIQCLQSIVKEQSSMETIEADNSVHVTSLTSAAADDATIDQLLDEL